jgi:hypothetical protein
LVGLNMDENMDYKHNVLLAFLKVQLKVYHIIYVCTNDSCERQKVIVSIKASRFRGRNSTVKLFVILKLHAKVIKYL